MKVWNNGRGPGAGEGKQAGSRFLDTLKFISDFVLGFGMQLQSLSVKHKPLAAEFFCYKRYNSPHFYWSRFLLPTVAYSLVSQITCLLLLLG